MRGARSRRGTKSTTRSGRTAAWDTARRKSLRQRRQRASTQLSEGQGTQTPSLAPRAPPSRLKPEMEPNRVVVFLRERKRGAGHAVIAADTVARMEIVAETENRMATTSGCRRRKRDWLEPAVVGVIANDPIEPAGNAIFQPHLGSVRSIAIGS